MERSLEGIGIDVPISHKRVIQIFNQLKDHGYHKSDDADDERVILNIGKRHEDKHNDSGSRRRVEKKFQKNVPKTVTKAPSPSTSDKKLGVCKKPRRTNVTSKVKIVTINDLSVTFFIRIVHKYLPRYLWIRPFVPHLQK